jgi:hypothetical protein
MVKIAKIVGAFCLIFIQQVYTGISSVETFPGNCFYNSPSVSSRTFLLPDQVEEKKMDLDAKMDLDTKVKHAHSWLLNENEDEINIESRIKNLFSSAEFIEISNKGWKAEIEEDDEQKASIYFEIAAIGGNAIAQERWSDYLLSHKYYDKAAKWYILAAANGNPDALAYLRSKNILQMLQKGNHQGAQQQLAELWKSK